MFKLAKTAALAAIVLSTTAVVAIAAGPHPAFKLRHDNFEAMGRSMKGIGDELKKPAPNVAAIQKNAKALAAASTRIAGYFPRGTGPEAGVKTEALPVIWQRPADFSAAADRLVGATKNLQVAAASGDLAKIQPAVGAVGQSCKGCHETFRKPRG